jgi:hypothetical protein
LRFGIRREVSIGVLLGDLVVCVGILNARVLPRALVKLGVQDPMLVPPLMAGGAHRLVILPPTLGAAALAFEFLHLAEGRQRYRREPRACSVGVHQRPHGLTGDGV